ncbi:MAG: hypothetical protein WC817_04455 [Patescibacteria group bacterium]|jgi:hypothetical protein
MKSFNKKQLLFGVVFILAGLVLLQIPVTHLVGSGARFTAFDAFGPIAGGFLGSMPGAVSVFLMQIFNFVLHGAHVQDVGTIIRLFPMIFAAAYFGKRTKLNVIVPALAILAFVASPIGRSAWYFSLYWLIPMVCYFYQDKFLLARSLGSTFTAHAVGGALWVYLVPMPATVWIALIPVVAMERLSFAIGISVMYLVVNNVLNYLNEKQLFSYQLPVNQNYVWNFAKN